LIKDIESLSYIKINNLKKFEKGKDDFKTLEKLTLLSGTYSRFRLDKHFKKKEYESLYKQWIYNSVYKEKALEVIVYKENNSILGFTTLEKKTNNLLDISLVAVDETARGKKIGTQLIEYSINYALKNGYSKIQVVTQQNNLPAVNLYKKCGFRIKSTEYIYHYWNL
jgi:ribosomal protein S18 acetylase RimI-like enzyme